MKQIILVWVSKIHVFIYKESLRTAELKLEDMGRFLLCVQETNVCFLPKDRNINKYIDKNHFVERSMKNPQV